MPNVLIIEDDEVIGATLEAALRAGGYGVERYQSGLAGLAAVAAFEPELVLLDLGLPDLDGLTVCRELRVLLPSAVIVLVTARREQLDIVSGLESGADDYLTKPFSTVELLARVRAHMRRSTGDTRMEAPVDTPLVIGSLSFDAAARRVLVGGREVTLRAKEFDLLARFVREPGIAIRREDLMSDVWDANWFGSTKTLDVHVASLRRQLKEIADAAGPAVTGALPEIVTLRGFGYRMDAAGR
ncbi:response regulator transcription factor [Glaciibacter sp. 2TAF33]|uniref:response regulator transcription factor n=1 Tax=Glaciibacter sp. 2TAF33 TaxID=3233015 RepID=UPI003F91E44E